MGDLRALQELAAAQQLVGVGDDEAVVPGEASQQTITGGHLGCRRQLMPHDVANHVVAEIQHRVRGSSDEAFGEETLGDLQQFGHVAVACPGQDDEWARPIGHSQQLDETPIPGRQCGHGAGDDGLEPRRLMRWRRGQRVVADQLGGVERVSAGRRQHRVDQRLTVGGVGDEGADELEHVVVLEVTELHLAHRGRPLELTAQLCGRWMVAHRASGGDPSDTAHAPLYHVVHDRHLGRVQPLDVIEEYGDPALRGDGPQALDEVGDESDAPTVVILGRRRRLERAMPAGQLGQCI